VLCQETEQKGRPRIFLQTRFGRSQPFLYHLPLQKVLLGHSPDRLYSVTEKIGGVKNDTDSTSYKRRVGKRGLRQGKKKEPENDRH
jgi:hypothetical protein